MAALDRLGWAAGLAFEAYGLKIGVRMNTLGAMDHVLGALPPGACRISEEVVEQLYSLTLGGDGPRPGMRRFHTLYANSERLARTHDREAMLAAFEDDLKLTVATAARSHLFVHAGVVGWQEKAILIPGASRAGKSTLVAALLGAGATYYSDEYALLDADGRVHPYPQPISLRQRGATPARRVTAETLGSDTGFKPLPVGLVVFTRYQPNARWRPRVLPRGRAVLKLLEHTTAARFRPNDALAILDRATVSAVALDSARGEAELYAERLLKWWAARPPQSSVATTP